MQSKMMLGNAEIKPSATFQRDGAEPFFVHFFCSRRSSQRVRVACGGRDSHGYAGSSRLSLTMTKNKHSKRLLLLLFIVVSWITAL